MALSLPPRFMKGPTEGRSAVIIGSGHLAYRIRLLAKSRHVKVKHIAGAELGHSSDGESRMETLARVLADVALESEPAVFLVDENDERNLELLIALVSMNSDLRIVAALFNEFVAPHLQAAHPNVRVLNPARIAAQTFVAALDAPRKLSLRYAPAPIPKDPTPRKSDFLVRRLVMAFVGLIVLATFYFHAAEGLSLLDSLYFVIVTTATVGYGDISLAKAGPVSKVVGILMILSSTAFIWMIFSLTVDNIIKQRVQLSLGRRKYNRKGHVILCGLGRLGYFVAEGLIERGEDVLVIERNEGSPNIQHFRAIGVDVYIGDARLPGVLRDVGVSKAKALFSLVDSDFGNLEIGLNARSFDPTLRLILRIYDDSMSKMIRENLDIQLTYSMTAIADEAFFDAVLPQSP